MANPIIPTLVGRKTKLTIIVGADACPDSVPLVCASENGFSPLGATHPDPQTVALADWMRAATDGAYIAVVDAPPAPRRVGLIQDNRGGGGEPNFYESRHSRRDNVWKDFYYRSLFALIDRMDARWNATDIELSHPTGHGWPRDLLTVVLEALGHLSDERSLSLRRVHLSCCTQDLTAAAVNDAVRTLQSEQTGSDAPRHAPFLVSECGKDGTHPSGFHGASLWKVDVT